MRLIQAAIAFMVVAGLILSAREGLSETAAGQADTSPDRLRAENAALRQKVDYQDTVIRLLAELRQTEAQRRKLIDTLRRVHAIVQEHGDSTLTARVTRAIGGQ